MRKARKSSQAATSRRRHIESSPSISVIAGVIGSQYAGVKGSHLGRRLGAVVPVFHLSRIPKAQPQMLSLPRIHHRLRYRYGGTSSGRRGCGAGSGVASPGTVEPARRSGSGAGGLVVYRWLDQRAFERGFRRGRGQRSTVAGLVQPGRRRCTAGFVAARTVSGQGGLGGCRRRGGIGGSGGGSAELDAASFAGRNRETNRGPHFQVATICELVNAIKAGSALIPSRA